MVTVVVDVVTAAVVVAVTVPILLLKVVQLAEDKAPLLVEEAVGRLKVCVVPVEEILKEVPLVPVVKVCTDPVKPFMEVIALPAKRLANVLVVTSPLASVVKIFVLVVFVPMPAKRTVPVVCNCARGFEVPMPTFPEFLL